MSISRLLSVAIAIACCSVILPSQTKAQSYIFAGEGNGLDVITHPIGYDGNGGFLNVSVGIDPTSVNFAEMQISAQNVVRTWNQLEVTTGNLVFGLPSNTFDFESVLLHEVGHSLGLGHVNMGAQSNVDASERNYTTSTNGADNVFTFNAGADGIIGSSDDVRGDDDNLNYFKIADNNPFTIDPSGIVDSTTYSRDLADLPTGHLYATNGDRTVAATLFGLANTEDVMQQGQSANEAQRTLTAADVVGIRYAESGLDEIQGTADDYDLQLNYVLWDGNAATRPDILIDMDTAVSFASSASSGAFIGGTDHIQITSNLIRVNPNFDWYFNTVLTVPEPGHLGFLSLLAVGFLRRRKS